MLAGALDHSKPLSSSPKNGSHRARGVPKGPPLLHVQAFARNGYPATHRLLPAQFRRPLGKSAAAVAWVLNKLSEAR